MNQRKTITVKDNNAKKTYSRCDFGALKLQCMWFRLRVVPVRIYLHSSVQAFKEYLTLHRKQPDFGDIWNNPLQVHCMVMGFVRTPRPNKTSDSYMLLILLHPPSTCIDIWVFYKIYLFSILKEFWKSHKFTKYFCMLAYCSVLKDLLNKT